MNKQDTLCPTCGRSDFKSHKGMAKHHAMSHGESIAGYSLTCDFCGCEFRDTHKDRRFCSKGCYGSWQSQNRVGEDAAHWQGGSVELNCETCGASYSAKPNQAESSRFCSRPCQYEALSGEGSPAWKGGFERYRGANWNRQQDRCRVRDDHTCQGCGVRQEELDRALDVHHIVPFRLFGVENYKEANKLSNLVSLCASCHNEWEGTDRRP